VAATDLHFVRIAADDLPEGVIRYGMVAGDVTVAFAKNQTFGCGPASAGPVEGTLDTGFLDVVTEATDPPSTRYRAAGTMEPVTLDLRMHCGPAGWVEFEITAPGDAWLQTMDGVNESPWRKSDDPDVLEGSYSVMAPFGLESATWTWSWRFE
jgi:hypothetical protein